MKTTLSAKRQVSIPKRLCDQLEIVTGLLKIPGGGLTPALLRLDPIWKPLRNDPRFQKLSEEKKQ